jgi:hypothetical protein
LPLACFNENPQLDIDESTSIFNGAPSRPVDSEQTAKYDKLGPWTKGRKRVLLIAASILAARKPAQYDGGKRVPATVAAISDAVRWADEIMRAIDERWPVPKSR